MKKIILILAIIGLAWPIRAQLAFNNYGNLFIANSAMLQASGNFTNGASGSLSGNGTFSLKGNFTNNGIYSTTTGIMEMNGNTLQQIIGNITFYTLRLNNTSTGARLNNTIGVTNTLDMTDGDLDLNGSNINLGTTASIMNESNDKRIYGNSGVITTTRNINAPSNLNVGGMGIIITTNANLGSTIIERGHQVQGYDWNNSIQRYYNINPTNNTSLDANLKFMYFENELNGVPEVDMVFWRSADNGNTWTVLATDSVNYSANYAVKSGIESFSRWTLSSTVVNPLPIELLDFSTQCESGHAKIQWSVASETNNQYYLVERSIDDDHYSEIARIDGVGNTSSQQDYFVIDMSNNNNFPAYYRLKQVDFNGQIKEYGAVLSEECDGAGNAINVELYPNPFTENIQINMYTDIIGDLSLQVFDGQSNLVKSEMLNIFPGTNNFTIDLHKLASGEYYVCLKNEGYNAFFRITKN
jgi:hypothetical protein